MTLAISVSVIIAVRNGLPYVTEAAKSALCQTRGLADVIVVDDGSTDGSREALGRIGDPRLVIVKNSRAGVSSARNLGAQVATGNWLMFLDADDRLADGALEALISKVANGAVLVYGDYERIDEGGNNIGNRRFLRRVRNKPSGNVLEPLLAGNFLINGGVLICERNAYHAVGGFDERLFLCEDWRLWCQLAAAGRAIYVPRRVLDYRVHTQSVMMRKLRTFDEFRPALDAVFGDSGLKAKVGEQRFLKLRNRGELSLMTYCAQQALRARKFRAGASMAAAVLARHPLRATWMAARLIGALAAL